MYKNIQKRDTMSNAHMRMYHYCLSLASETDDKDKKLSLYQEADYHLDTANRYRLVGKVCGNEFVSIR